jgi:transcription antitermination factor NusG
MTQWFVAHTRPRCEKRVVDYCRDLGIATTLPCYKSVRKYPGKSVTFEKPLFPGYVFLQTIPECRAQIFQSDYVANILSVFDQKQFEQQLQAVLIALESGLEIRLAPEIGEGCKVRIKNGPLAGMDGWVESRTGFDVVLLRIDFISQAAAVKMSADDVERA